MKSIKSLIEELNLLRNSWEFKSLSLIDEHITTLESKVRGLEAKNMKYFCLAHRSTDQSIPNNVVTALNFDSTFYPQFGNMHDNTRDNDKIFIRRNGVYQISAGAIFAAGGAAGTQRWIYILLNRGGVLTYIATGSYDIVTFNQAMNISTEFYCYIGDIIQLVVYHNTGAPLDIEAIGTFITPYLAVTERMEDLDPSEYGLLDPSANMR